MAKPMWRKRDFQDSPPRYDLWSGNGQVELRVTFRGGRWWGYSKAVGLDNVPLGKGLPEAKLAMVRAFELKLQSMRSMLKGFQDAPR